MDFIQDEKMIQALSSDGRHKALSIRVHIGGPVGSFKDFDPHIFKDLVMVLVEFHIAGCIINSFRFY